MAKEIVAMLLAGGKGTRLEALTRKIAKPAVSFGGKYRIIDFPLSNCANSRIDTVGVLTQYESVFLNTYIGNGEKWGLNGVRSLTASLPPRQTEKGAAWYKGTADAIYQNLDFLDSLNPEYVLILSGDHIYKMNYDAMLQAHQEHDADLTVAVLDVPLIEASRFGIMSVNPDMMITAFAEKPAKPTSTLASMGIYIFTYKVLKQALTLDAKAEKSDHDFGKDVIPYLLGKKKRLLAYRHRGYWKDVGTIASLWSANMDLIDDEAALDLYLNEDDLKIFSEDTHSVPQYVGKQATVVNSMVNQGAIVLGRVEHSVIFNEVIIEEGAYVSDSVIMPGVIVKKGARVHKAIVASEVVVPSEAVIDGSQDIVLVAN
ncbi:MAG: glucose-1-phosphate adenylyltransferase [Bacilli bacterium]|jgi:glucose-1-phosphate adenylyltransferase